MILEILANVFYLYGLFHCGAGLFNKRTENYNKVKQWRCKWMEMRSFILNGDILSVEVSIDDNDYRLAVKWTAPKKPYGDTWILKSYANKLTGKKDLSEEKIAEFLDIINADWNWNMDDFKN